MTTLFSLRVAVASAFLAAAVAGCAVKSPPATEAVRKDALQGAEVRAAWAATNGATADVNAGKIDDNWLATFNDAQLTALVNEAIAKNPDLRAAAARVEQAAAYARSAQAELLPLSLIHI